jgi:hypothetical protein
MSKISFIDRNIFELFLKILSAFTTILSFILIFTEIPKEYKKTIGIIFGLLIIIFYVVIWLWANRLKKINLKINGSNVTIKTGDLFTESDFKAIAFNEYFDTIVDDKIIAKKSINGIFITEKAGISVAELDNQIESYTFHAYEYSSKDESRPRGKKQKYKLGTVCTINEYMLTAFSKFDEHNRAVITMSEYLDFLITFWDNVNKLYAQKNVSVPIFGSGITRIKEHKNISDEDLLKIMLWTFKISEMKFKYPAKLTIVIHESKIDEINLFDVKFFEK